MIGRQAGPREKRRQLFGGETATELSCALTEVLAIVLQEVDDHQTPAGLQDALGLRENGRGLLLRLDSVGK